MIPSKFGMAPIGAGSITNHNKFSEATSTIFATPNNSQSNQKYISQLVKTADPIIPIQIEREKKMLNSGIPKVCCVTFYPQGNEFFIIPIAVYFRKNPVPSIPCYFIIPEEPCNIYFECEDPNKLIQYLKLVPELSDLNLSAQIIAEKSTFVQLFCNFNAYCHIQAGNFVQVSRPEFEGDFAQVVSVDKDRKRCLLKLIPRIDYENLSKYHLTTQSELNDLMPNTYRPPKALFDKNKLSSINSNVEYGSKKLNIDKTTEIELVVWSGKKFYGSFQYKFFDFDSIKTIFPKISLSELEIFRKNIYMNEKFIRGFVEACEHLYSELTGSLNNSPSIPEIENDIDEIAETSNTVPLTASSSKNLKKKKAFFPISSLNDLTQYTEIESNNEPKDEPKPEKKSERKNELKKEKKSGSKSESKNEKKNESKSESKSESKISSNSKILPGTKVFPQYGQYADILFKVKTNDGKIITAEAEDAYMSIPYRDFSLKELYIDEPIEKYDKTVQFVPPEPPKPPEPPEEPKPKPKKTKHKDKTKTKSKHKSNESSLFDVLGFDEDEKISNKSLANDDEESKGKQYESVDVQTDQDNYIIPRENDLIEQENGETAMIIDESNILPSLAVLKRKVKGSEILQSKVISDFNYANDSKGDRLNVNEEIKIIKGRNSGEFARIAHIAPDSLFVKYNSEVLSVQHDYTRKLKEDAQKVETEDILGENIILLKNHEIASKPMLIQRFDRLGNIYVENTHNDDSVKSHNFTIKMKDWSAKWMFESEIPVEMRFNGSNSRKTKRKGSK